VSSVQVFSGSSDSESVVRLGESFFEADVTVDASRSGSGFCGPASGPRDIGDSRR
jgi:hypothetical protein